MAVVWLTVAVSAFGEDRVYDAADLVRASRMVEGIIPADIEFADLDGDGAVTADDLALMLRRVHGQELPVRLEQKTIGPAGGSIGSTNTILLSVPEGAFDRDVTLTLELVPAADGPPVGEDTYGPLYQVNGIPDNVPVSLTVRVPLPAGGNSTNTLLEMGEYTRGTTSGLGWYYRYVDAVADGDSLVWHAPPIPEYTGEWMTAAEGSDADDGLRSTARTTTSSAHSASYRWRPVLIGLGIVPRMEDRELIGPRFKIIWNRTPSLAERTHTWHLVEALEHAYATLSADFDFSPRTSWPLDVYVTRMSGDEPGGEMVSSFWGVNYHWLEIDDRNLWPRNLPLLRTLAGHEFFHIVQSFYHARKDTLWLDEATATWFEKYLHDGDPADYEPKHAPSFKHMPRLALRGMHVESGLLFGYSMKDVQSWGYTLASFVEYLDRRHGLGLPGLATLHQRLKAGDHPVAALIAMTPGTVDDFKQSWRDYTRGLFESPVWPVDVATVLSDPPPAGFTPDGINTLARDNTIYAFGRRAEGPYGRIMAINDLEAFATAREYRMQVQRLGARSLALAMMNPALTDQLPDPVRMIGEVQWDNPDDMQHLRLMAVLQGGPGPGSGPPVALPFDTQDWHLHRSTYRIEVSFPRPVGRFSYMLGVFNDNLNPPYDTKKPVTLRSFIGAYKLPEYSSTFTFPNADGPILEFNTSAWELLGDLGGVRGPEFISVVTAPIPIVTVRLAHPDVASIRLRIDGDLVEPLTRTFSWYDRDWTREDWTSTATPDEMRWSTWVPGESSNRYFSVELARTTGIELPAPAPDQSVQYNVSYRRSVQSEVTVVYLQRDWPPYNYTNDHVYSPALMMIKILGSQFEEGTP